MIEFQIASLEGNPQHGEIWQGLNAASVALQKAAQSEEAVYQVFGEQLLKLGLHASVNLLDESGENLRVVSVVFSKRLMKIIELAEKRLGLSSIGFSYLADAAPADAAVLQKGDIIFLPDNSEKMRQVITPNIYRFAKPFLKPFLKLPAILAPLYADSKIVGVLYLAGERLRIEDVPAIGAFSTHLSIALENARLFQAMQQAEKQQRKLANELKQQTHLLEAILAATPDNFLVFDLDGRFLFISNAILEYLQVDVADVVGKTWRELNLPPAFGELSDQDRAAVLETSEAASREFVYPMPDGEVEIEFVTNPFLGPNGEITAFVTTARDVTERKQTMQAMYRTQKMESLGILAGGIAHDFNNLLVAMLGQTTLAQTHLSKTNPAFTHISKAVQAAEQAASLTRQLLAYSGGGQFTIQPVALNRLIDESVDLLNLALPKQVTLQLNLAPDLPHIEGDVTQIQQVIMNLIINAAEAIGEQAGTIWLSTVVCQITSQDHRFWRYTDHPLPSQKYAKLSVQDSGIGMDEATRSKIFDPFFTTKFTGRGLGLATVSGIIRSHKGGLHVKSAPGQGTTFELLFPIAANIAEIPPEEPEQVSMNGKGLVLVIDDERAVREAVTDILEIEEIGVLTAANGDEGIHLYKAHSDEIDLILLDLSMPGKSGQETFEELKAVDPNVRILLSSGYSEDLATRGFASPPLVGFLQKPYRLDTFVSRLNQFL
ncbi:ATP-binding protein [Candidatus Leptofilum sp.]|uniref:hybrid sensor histidine kinase/response regulator n=1 Tax=Candidatus Leptofilum sp. TaxID=3241576 RepID=UPI003B5C0C32